jgi:hypothetical protein
MLNTQLHIPTIQNTVLQQFYTRMLVTQLLLRHLTVVPYKLNTVNKQSMEILNAQMLPFFTIHIETLISLYKIFTSEIDFR